MFVYITDTLYNAILRIARNLLETRENIKVSPIHSITKFVTNFHGDQAKKKFQNGRFSKWLFFKIANSQKFSVKMSWISPWVSRID